jgi:septal ring factor EnvC (AmiA/AmiB activator)
MNENEMNLDEPATRRDLKELEVATRRDLKELELATRRDLKELEVATRRDLKELELGLKELELGLKELETELKAQLANHPTHAQLDASLRQVMLHIETTAAQSANAIAEANRAELARQTKAIGEDLAAQIRGLDDQYRGLPERVTKLETAVFSPPPKRKRKAG